MRKLLNVMYITTQGGYLFRDGECIVVRVEGQDKIRFPLFNLEGLVCFGNISVSTPLLGLCAERGVGVSFLSENGRFLARSTGGVHGSVILRRAQYRLAESDSGALQVAKSFVLAKVINSRVLLQRARRDSGNGGVFNGPILVLGQITGQAEKSPSLEYLRGKEGEAAREYFSVFNDLVFAQKNDFIFRERSRRPPLDNVNALLSFVYTLLAHDVESALESVGLDPAVGFLHRVRPGRASLALDLMEEFRAYVADRLVLSLINRKQVQATGFRRSESGAIEMDDDTRKVVLVAYQSRKREEIEHPFLKEKISVGLLPYAQSMLLCRFIRGDIDGYPPFFWR